MPELTEKELALIKDQLASEGMLVKKYRIGAANCGDSAMSQLLNQAADIHLKHFNTLISYVR